MKITIKFADSEDWEELEMLSEDTSIQAIRIDDVVLTEDTLRCRKATCKNNEHAPPRRQRPLETIPGSAHERDNFFNSHFYGMLDVIHHRVLNIHGPIKAHLGFAASDLKERDLFEFIHPDDAENLVRSFATLFEGQSVVDLPIQLIANHGEYVPISLTVSPAEGGDAAFYATILGHRNITNGQVYGYERTELAGHNHRDLAPESYHATLDALLADAMAMANQQRPLPSQSKSYERLHAGGRRTPVEGIVTQCDLARRTIQLIEREVQDKKNVVCLSLDFEGRILDGYPLRDFLG